MEPNKESRTGQSVLRAKLENGVTLLEFDASWCKPCKEQGVIIEKLKTHYRGIASILKLDVDSNPGLAMSLGVTSIPTMIVFRDGDEIERFIGKQLEDTLIRSLEAALEKG